MYALSWVKIQSNLLEKIRIFFLLTTALLLLWVGKIYFIQKNLQVANVREKN